jgi:hypothetical protein
MQVTVLPLEKKVIEKIVVVDTRDFCFLFLRLFQRRRMTGTLRQARFTSYPRQASDNKQTNSQFSSTHPNTNLHCHLYLSFPPYSFFLSCLQSSHSLHVYNSPILFLISMLPSPHALLTIHSFTIYTFLSFPPLPLLISPPPEITEQPSLITGRNPSSES